MSVSSGTLRDRPAAERAVDRGDRELRTSSAARRRLQADRQRLVAAAGIGGSRQDALLQQTLAFQIEDTMGASGGRRRRSRSPARRDGLGAGADDFEPRCCRRANLQVPRPAVVAGWRRPWRAAAPAHGRSIGPAARGALERQRLLVFLSAARNCWSCGSARR